MLGSARWCRWITAIAILGAIALMPSPATAAWKAGTGRVAITPKQSMWMAGYASRTKPSEGAIHDLWAKALAIEDPAGQRAILVALDVCGIDRALSNRVRDALKSRHGLERDRIVLACSHTHSGPVVGTNLLTMYKIDADQHRRIVRYEEFLAEAIVTASSQAIGRLEEGRLAWATGRCDFAVNRRANKEAEVPELRRRLALQGPVDHDVPVLKATRANGDLLAVVFGYACHCTVLDFNQFCGDYAGFAQIDIEKTHPSAQAMFVAGCGGDQNPIPRRALDLAVRYGQQLASSVEDALQGPLKAIDGNLSTGYQEPALAFASLPTREQIERDTRSDNFYIASRAKQLLATILGQGKLESTYPYPVEIWRLGGLTWVFLGGEVVVDYPLRIKRNMGSSQTWVSAYCNDVMAYIPSKRVLKEGGYEGGGAMVYYGQPAVWSDDVEETIMAAVARCLSVIRRPATSASAAPAPGRPTPTP
jgi:neutral ceramidase